MASPFLLLVFIYLCGLRSPLDAMPICRLQRNLVQASHKLLTELGAPFSYHCRPYNANITFPKSIIPAATTVHPQPITEQCDTAVSNFVAGSPQCCKVLWAVYETLNRTSGVFLEYNVKEGGVDWNLGKLKVFRNLQHRLLNQGQCFSSGSHILDPYYANVTTALQNKFSATCGWMALRRDVQWVLGTSLREHHGCFN